MLSLLRISAHLPHSPKLPIFLKKLIKLQWHHLGNSVSIPVLISCSTSEMVTTNVPQPQVFEEPVDGANVLHIPKPEVQAEPTNPEPAL